MSGPHLIKHEQFPSRHLRNQRDLIVYLPPGYDAQPQRSFPVLYLHDGQNLFDGATSFIAGMDWHVGQTADDFKSRMGCHTRPRYFYVKVRDRVGTALLRAAREAKPDPPRTSANSTPELR